MRKPIGTRHLCLVAGFLFFAGCSGKEEVVPAKGKLTRGGNPIQVREQSGRITISFYRMKDGEDPKNSDPQSAMVKPDGSFEVFGPSGKGIPAGKYKVSISVMSGAPDPTGMSDMFGGMFLIERTPIEIEVKKGSEIHIELNDHMPKKP